MFTRGRNAEKVKGFPVLYDKRVKGFKEKDAVLNEQVASSNCEYFEDSCS